MKPIDPFMVATPTRMQTAIKRAVMGLYSRGLLPASAVQWTFRVFRLKNA